MRQLPRTDAVSWSGDVYADQGATITLRFPAPLIPRGTSPMFLDIEPEAGTSPEHASLGTSGIGEPEEHRRRTSGAILDNDHAVRTCSASLRLHGSDGDHSSLSMVMHHIR